MKTKPEIVKMLVCTTAHVPRRLAECFDNQTHCPEGIVYNNVEYGWLIRYWPPEDCEEREELWRLMPVSLRAVIDVAEENGCKMILFDNDAEELEGLKTYEW